MHFPTCCIHDMLTHGMLIFEISYLTALRCRERTCSGSGSRAVARRGSGLRAGRVTFRCCARNHGCVLILMNRFVFRGETRPLPHSRYRNTDTHNGFPSTHAHSAPAKMSGRECPAADWPFEPLRYCWLMLARNADTHKVSAHSSQ
jgi:hypothetical protein